MTENRVAKTDSHQGKRETPSLLQAVMPVTQLFSRPTLQIIDGRLVAVVIAKPASEA